MADIFMSYAREDAAFAGKLVAALNSAGYTVWWDQNLGTGARYIEATDRELKVAQAVVVLWSKCSVASHWVADEAIAGRDSGRLVPISIDGSEPPLGFRQFQVTDFRHWNHGAGPPLPALLTSLSALVRDRVDEQAISPARATSIWRRPIAIAGALAAAVVVGLAVFAFVSRSSPSHSSPAHSVATLAVLPFSDSSGDQAHLAAGMTDELLSRLRRVRGSRSRAASGWAP